MHPSTKGAVSLAISPLPSPGPGSGVATRGRVPNSVHGAIGISPNGNCHCNACVPASGNGVERPERPAGEDGPQAGEDACRVAHARVAVLQSGKSSAGFYRYERFRTST